VVDRPRLRKGLALPDEGLDFLLCGAVIGPIEREVTFRVVLLALARVRKQGGVLLSMFPERQGVLRVYDQEDGAERTSLLYKAEGVDRRLQEPGLRLIPPKGRHGGIRRFLDAKGVWHAMGFWRREVSGDREAEAQ